MYNLSYSNDLRSFNNRIFPRNCVSPSGFIIVTTVMSIWIPMRRTKQFAATASNSGQSDLFPATWAPIHLLFHHSDRTAVLVRRFRFPIRSDLLRRLDRDRSTSFNVWRRGGGVETNLTDVRGGYSGDAAVDAERSWFRYGFEFRFFVLCLVRHLFTIN